MKKNIIILILISFLASCDDHLDVKPIGKLIPSKIEDFDRLLNSGFLYNADYLDHNYSTLLSLLTDNLVYSENMLNSSFSASDPITERIMAYKFNRPYVNPTMPDLYWDEGIYTQIYYYNNVIEGIKEFIKQDEQYGKSVLSQAKAARAFTYLNAAMIYGPAYKKDGDNSTKCIPYRTVASATQPNPDLATTQQVFDKVEEELLYGLTNFIPDRSANVRFNKVSLNAALAYYYMLKADYANMLKYANDAWQFALTYYGNADGLIYNYNNVTYVSIGYPAEPGTDPETTQMLEYTGPYAENFTSTHSNENLLYRKAPHSASEEYISPEYYNLFSDNDLRKSLFILKIKGFFNSDGDSDGIVKVHLRNTKLRYGKTSGISYPELLLMRAEAYARTNNPEKALADLNVLRKYRYQTGTQELSGLTDDDLIYEILKERRRELPMPSYKRIIDLKRFEANDKGKPWTKTEVVHHVMRYTSVPIDQEPLEPVQSGVVYRANVNSDKFILPISNTILVKNPQWNIPLLPEIYNP